MVVIVQMMMLVVGDAEKKEWSVLRGFLISTCHGSFGAGVLSYTPVSKYLPRLITWMRCIASRVLVRIHQVRQ